MNYYNYFTEVEQHFVRRRGKHMWISPLDWSLVATWRASGVPLNVALRGIDIAMDTWDSKPHRSSDRLSTLFYCHNSVMEEYARHLEAHLGEEPGESRSAGEKPPAGESETPDGPGRDSVLRFLASRILEIEPMQAKHSPGEDDEAITRVLSRLRQIAQSVESAERIDLEALERDLSILDDLLVSELRLGIAQEQLAAWEQEARKELKVYKKRLPKETYAKIVDNFLRGRIRRQFRIGELSLFHL